VATVINVTVSLFDSSNIPLKTIKILKNFNLSPSLDADELDKLFVLFDSVRIVLFAMDKFPVDSLLQIGSGGLAARKSKALGTDIKTERNNKSFLARNLSAR
jgi:hypothetical protein